MMLVQLLRAGLGSALRRFDLVILVYGIQLAFAAVLAAPIARSLEAIVGPTGFGAELVAGADFVLWADILVEEARTVGRRGLHLLWLLPLVMLWKAAKGVGLIHALGMGSGASFWRGAMRFGLRSVIVGVIFTALAALMGTLVLMLLGTIATASSSPVAAYWILVVLMPLALLALFLGVDVLRATSRAAIATADISALASTRAGFKALVRQPRLLTVYGAWKLLGLMCLMLSFQAELHVAAGGSAAIAALFILQQVFFVIGVVCSVSWYGALASAGPGLWLQEAESEL